MLKQTDPRLVRQRIKRERQLRSHKAFVDYHFPTIEDAAFEWGRHHEVMCRTIDRVFTGEIMRLIITVPPGYTKTLLATTMLAARGYAINPNCRFLHTSASNPLVLQNSRQVKDIIKAERYQELFPRTFKLDGDSRWSLDEGGVFYALPGKGTITGMRAGRKRSEPNQFTGALLIDDPQKAQDADKKANAIEGAELKAVNTRFHSTLKSRLFPASTTPIIVIQQRLHFEDLAGHLLMGGSNEKWHHLCLPVEILPDWTYPPEWSHGIHIPHDLSPGPLWEFAHTAEQIDLLRFPESVFAAQYMQQPLEGGGLIFAPDHFREWNELPELEYRMVYADTAQKATEMNDWTVFQCWGRGRDGKAYLIDQLRMRLEAPELRVHGRAFWAKHKQQDSITMGVCRAFKVEDKVSGTGLIQDLAREGIPMLPIPRAKDKVMRAHDVVASFASGQVFHPPEKIAPWVKTWRAEMLSFPQGSYDDQVDPTLDAVAEMCGGVLSSLDAL